MLHHRKTWFCLNLRNVKNDEGQLSLDEESKKEAWKEHYERLLNVRVPTEIKNPNSMIIP